jgi:hypothetical protein
MSQIKIRAALETALATITPSIDTQYENTAYTPKTGVPYQSVSLVINSTNPTIGDAFYREIGIMLITLHYPLLGGTFDVMTQAEKIRAKFKRGQSFTKDNISVLCDKTPDIRSLPNEPDRFVVAVKIYFYSNIIS